MYGMQAARSAEMFAALSAQKCSANCSASRSIIHEDFQGAKQSQCKFNVSISKILESQFLVHSREDLYEKFKV